MISEYLHAQLYNVAILVLVACALHDHSGFASISYVSKGEQHYSLDFPYAYTVTVGHFLASGNIVGYDCF